MSLTTRAKEPGVLESLMDSPRKSSDPNVSSSRCCISSSKCPESLNPTNHQRLLSCHTPSPTSVSSQGVPRPPIVCLPSAPVQSLSGPQATSIIPPALHCPPSSPLLTGSHYSGSLANNPRYWWVTRKGPCASLSHTHREHMTTHQTGCGDQKARRGLCCPESPVMQLHT